MTSVPVKEKGKGKETVRAGSHALSLLAAPLSAELLRNLADEPIALADLRQAVGSPAHTTLRGRLRDLAEVGALERVRQAQFPGPVDCRLGPSGAGLLCVADVLEAWLHAAPDRPLSLRSKEARVAVKALVAGWSSTIVRALAARPLTLTELNRLIAGMNYPSLERRLAAMRTARLISAARGDRKGTPYDVTDWLRAAAGPLVAAAAWEREFRPGAAEPIGRLDLEATFLLAAPLLRMPEDVAGTARLAVHLGNAEGSRLVGAVVDVRAGRVVSCVARLEAEPDASAVGSVSAWLQMAVEGDGGGLELSGDQRLVTEVFDALRESFLDPAGTARAS